MDYLIKVLRYGFLSLAVFYTLVLIAAIYAAG